MAGCSRTGTLLSDGWFSDSGEGGAASSSSTGEAGGPSVTSSSSTGGMGGAPTGSGGMGGASTGSGGTGGIPNCQPGAVIPCYSGPPGTEGVGQCTAGLQTCNADGTGYGACVGEVLPAAVEQCDKPGDEDCDGSEPAACGEARWAKIFGNLQDQFPNMIVADASGNVYLVGGLYGAANFGGANLVSAGDADAYIAKFDAGGNHLWSKQFGDNVEQTVTDIAFDPMGNVVIIGYYEGTIDLGGGPLPAGSYDSFIAKLTPDGNHVWSVRYGVFPGDYDVLWGIATDPSGDVLVSGYSGGSAQNIVIGKFSGVDGSQLWVKPVSAPGQQLIFESVVSDASGNVWITGQFQGTLTLGTTVMTSAGANDIFLTKLDPNGNFLWAKRFGDSADQFPGAIVVDSLGSPVIVGNFQGTLSFDGQGDLVSAGNHDVFVVKLTTDGGFQWSKRFGDAQQQASLRMAIDQFDNLYLTGEMAGIVSFGGAPLQSAGQADIFLVKLDASGNHVWSRRLGDSQSQIGRGVAVSSPGVGWVYMTGYVRGATDFGIGPPLVSAGAYDIVLASFYP